MRKTLTGNFTADGNAINVRRFMAEVVHFKIGDKARALQAQGIIEKVMLREC